MLRLTNGELEVEVDPDRGGTVSLFEADDRPVRGVARDGEVVR